MHSAVDSPYLVPFDGSFQIKDARTRPPKDVPPKGKLRKQRVALTDSLRELQLKLYGGDRHSLLIIFQALDAAGKDGTIRAVMSGVNPAGCQVSSFQRPSKEELDHDFLWRTACRLPRRGNIGIFNRSYYEEVLVVRVHPDLLAAQRVRIPKDPDQIWDWRIKAIRDHEEHLARQGTVVVKFFLHVSADEQKNRLLKRIEDPDRNWKFDANDVSERKHRAAYLRAYEAALQSSSRPWAPWYAIPADNKPFMRVQVADILVRTLERINPAFPTVSDARRAELLSFRESLLAEGEDLGD